MKTVGTATGGKSLRRAGLALLLAFPAVALGLGSVMLALGFGVAAGEDSPDWEQGLFKIFGFFAILGAAVLTGLAMFLARHPRIAGYGLAILGTALVVMFLGFGPPNSPVTLIVGLWAVATGSLILLGTRSNRIDSR